MIEVGIEFTAQELGVLAELLELPTAAGLEDNPLDDLPEVARGAVRDAVAASLEARQVVVRDGDRLHVAEPVDLIMTAASVPGLVAIVSRQLDEVIDTTFLSVTPDLGVEVSGVAHSVYRLTPFDPSDLLARVLRLSDLHPVATLDATLEPISTTADALEACAQAMFAGDDEAAVAALGAPQQTAQAFVDALKAKRSSSQITILHKPEEGRIEGGSVAWVDCGFRGVWTTEEAESEAGGPSGAVTVAPANAREIATELFSYLPQAFSQDELAPEP